MNIEITRKMAGAIELLLESHSRINSFKPQKYWYPLSLASYGVDEIIEALDSLCSFRTTMWEKTGRFEKKFAAYQGSHEAIMVNSGSSADLLMCYNLVNPRRPLLNRGDEILMPVLTWPTQIWSAMMAGLKVKLVDIDPDTLNIDYDDMEAKIGGSTRAVFLVHLLGNPCNMDRVTSLAQKHNLLIIEDCCEALGSEWEGTKVGNFGMSASFSFFFSHHISTMEGGAVVCRDQETAESLKILRAHGWVRNIEQPPALSEDFSEIDPRYAFVNWGFNMRPTEMQAGFGLHQIEKLPGFNDRREVLAGRFSEFINKTESLRFPVIDAKARPIWFALPIILQKGAPFTRKDIVSHLEAEGVETRPIVAGNLARHPVAEIFSEFRESTFSGADYIHQNAFYIGLSPFFKDEEMDRLIELFDRFLKFPSPWIHSKT